MNIACYFCVAVGLSCNLAGADPLDLIFPYYYKGNIDKVKFNEPSGLVFHPARETIFAVGDGGGSVRDSHRWHSGKKCAPQ